MDFSFDRSKHVFHYPAFEELIKDAIRFFNGTPVQPLPPIERFEGTGIYAIYFIGHNGIYRPFHEINRLDFRHPIYVGKAVPHGWRQGRETQTASSELYNRLCDHAKSIQQAGNLDLADFLTRFMILEDAASSLIGTVEAALIRHYRPLWNSVINGFGNHDPGRGRYNQEKSEWDVLHPGRPWADRCAPSSRNEAELHYLISGYFDKFKGAQW